MPGRSVYELLEVYPEGYPLCHFGEVARWARIGDERKLASSSRADPTDRAVEWLIRKRID